MSDAASEDLACRCYACQRQRRRSDGRVNNNHLGVTRHTIMRRRRNRDLNYYQGLRRMFGTFFCRGCKRKWQSINSWDNMYQECKECRIRCYPYYQRDAEAEDAVVPLEGHLQGLCEMCQTVGFSCSHLHGGGAGAGAGAGAGVRRMSV